MSIRIGCGSWADDDYVGVLYPKGLPKNARLATYARWFERIELNASYHRIPTPQTVAGWLAQTPPAFFFDVKLHRDFCNDPRHSATNPQFPQFLAAIQPLAEAKRLGAFLWTLPPSFGPKRRSLAELDAALEKLRSFAPVAVELRDRAWVDTDDARATTLRFFRDRGLVWVATDLPSVDAPRILPPIDEVTNPQLAYLRLHGRNPDYPHVNADEGHHYDYPIAELEQIAARIRALAAKAKHVHVSANNHALDFAPKAALSLRQLLGQPVPPPLKENADDQLSLL